MVTTHAFRYHSPRLKGHPRSQLCSSFRLLVIFIFLGFVGLASQGNEVGEDSRVLSTVSSNNADLASAASERSSSVHEDGQDLLDRSSGIHSHVHLSYDDDDGPPPFLNMKRDPTADKPGHFAERPTSRPTTEPHLPQDESDTENEKENSYDVEPNGEESSLTLADKLKSQLRDAKSQSLPVVPIQLPSPDSNHHYHYTDDEDSEFRSFARFTSKDAMLKPTSKRSSNVNTSPASLENIISQQWRASSTSGTDSDAKQSVHNEDAVHDDNIVDESPFTPMKTEDEEQQGHEEDVAEEDENPDELNSISIHFHPDTFHGTSDNKARKVNDYKKKEESSDVFETQPDKTELLRLDRHRRKKPPRITDNGNVDSVLTTVIPDRYSGFNGSSIELTKLSAFSNKTNYDDYDERERPSKDSPFRGLNSTSNESGQLQDGFSDSEGIDEDSEDFPSEDNNNLMMRNRRPRRSVVHLYDMVVCATGCNPLAYKGYGCYCGFLGSGLTVDGIDRCCAKHDWCYHHAKCPPLLTYFVPYYWTCNEGRPKCVTDYRGWKGVCGAHLCECDRQFAECLRKFPCPRSRAMCMTSPWRFWQNLIMSPPAPFRYG